VSGEQSSVTRSGISGGELKVADRPGDVMGLNRDVTTSKDTSQALVKGWNGAKALDEVGAQMDITSAAMPRLAKEIGDYAESKVVELKNQGNAEEAAKWEEGGAYRVAAHAALGAMGGGVGGALGATAAAEAAPTLGRLQSALQEKLTDAGLGNGAADAAAKLLVGGTAGTIAGAVGGGAGAAAGLNADLNNRQLHPTEVQVIKNKARDFAKSFYETDNPTAQQIAGAQAYLVYAALADVDRAQAYGNTLIGLQKDDQYIAAKRFLTTQKDTFINDAGQVQQVFTTKGNDFYEPLRYSNNNGDQAYRDFFWESVGINLPLPNNSRPSDKRSYNEREIQRLKQDLKNFTPGLITGAVVAGIGAIASKTNGVLPTKVMQGELTASPTKSRSTYERDIAVGNEPVPRNVSLVPEVHSDSIIASEKQSFARFSENSANRAYRGLDTTINERGIVEKERGLAEAANWTRADGSTWWPPYDGALPGTTRIMTLEPGSMNSPHLIDRFGRTSGSYVSPAGLSLESRALSSTPANPPSVYSIDGTITGVEKATVTPWFGKKGLGVQYKLPDSVQFYLDNSQLREK
jgi:Tuberculosis necrotizing toxin